MRRKDGHAKEIPQHRDQSCAAITLPRTFRFPVRSQRLKDAIMIRNGVSEISGKLPCARDPPQSL
jgi:hypothetical protein